MSICFFKLVSILTVVLLAAYYGNPQELNSTLYSTIYGASVAFSNENITFTCVARGSNGSNIIMGWSSEQYIAGGRRLEFISAERPGTTRTSGETVAILVDASVNEFIVSQLYVRIQPTISIASVQCQNTSSSSSITFRLAVNDTSVVCDKPSVCPGETVTCVCATGNSNSLAWVIDGSRLEFTSNDPLLTRQNVTGSNAYGILTNRYNENRIAVITSNLTLTASTDDTNLLANCENTDRSTSNAVIIPILQNCPGLNEATTVPGTEPASKQGIQPAGLTSGAIAGIIILTLMIVTLLIVVAIMAYFTWNGWKSLAKAKEDRDTKDEIINILRPDNEKKNEMITKLEEESKILKTEMEEKDEKIQELEKKNIRNNNKIQKLEDTKRELKQQIATMASEKDIMQLQLQTNSEEMGKLTGEVQSLKTFIRQQQLQLQTKSQEVETLKEELKRLQVYTTSTGE